MFFGLKILDKDDQIRALDGCMCSELLETELVFKLNRSFSLLQESPSFELFSFFSNGTTRVRQVNINPLEGSHGLESPFNPLQTQTHTHNSEGTYI